jgi:two-component sensor histidine kinase
LSGRLAISWEMQNDLLVLAWVETGGPVVSKPTSRGFGTRSVIASIESQLGGKADFDWRPEGLVCRLTVPLTDGTTAAAEPAPYREEPAGQPPALLNSRTA